MINGWTFWKRRDAQLTAYFFTAQYESIRMAIPLSSKDWVISGMIPAGMVWFKGSKDTKKWQVRVSVTCQDYRVLPRMHCSKIISSLSAFVVLLFVVLCFSQCGLVERWQYLSASDARSFRKLNLQWNPLNLLRKSSIGPCLACVLSSNYNMIFLRLCLHARLSENYILFSYAFSILFPRASGRSSSAKSNFVSSSGTAASHFDQTSSQHIPENLERSMERTWFFNPFHSTKTQVTQVTQVPPRPRNWS